MYDSDFPLRLAQLRAKKGVSARDMSLSIGQNPGYINNIETGKAKPSMEGFFYICEYLGISPAEFFRTETEGPSKLNSIVSDMRQLSDNQLDIIALLIKSMVENK